MFAGLKVWLLRLDDWLERNRRYVRPSAFLFSIVVAGLAVELLLVFIVSTYALALSVGGPTLQLMTGVISAISAAASALAASYIYKANVETRKTTIKPRIFVYGSTREERQKIVSPVGLPLHVVQIEKGGIWVENDGIGPAILGTVYVIDKVKGGIPLVTPNASYTFRRLAVNERIHLPNQENRELEKYLEPHVLLGTKTQVDVEYFDINRVRYTLRPEEQEVQLYAHALEKEWKGTLPHS